MNPRHQPLPRTIPLWCPAARKVLPCKVGREKSIDGTIYTFTSPDKDCPPFPHLMQPYQGTHLYLQADKDDDFWVVLLHEHMNAVYDMSKPVATVRYPFSFYWRLRAYLQIGASTDGERAAILKGIGLPYHELARYLTLKTEIRPQQLYGQFERYFRDLCDQF